MVLVHPFEEVLDFRFVCHTVFDDVPTELKVLSSKRMIEINGHLFGRHLQHLSQETLSLFILQGNDGILVYILRVEHAIMRKRLPVECQYAFGIVLTVSLLLGEQELEVGVLSVFNNFLLESRQRHLAGSIKLHGFLFLCLLDKMFLTVLYTV